MGECEALYRGYCQRNGIPCRLNEHIPLTYGMSLSERQRKIKGTYGAVMRGDITLIGFGNGSPEEARQEYNWLYTAP